MSKHRYALPYAAPHVAYAHAPFVYNALDTGLVYPVAEAYVHDAAGELSALTTNKAREEGRKNTKTRRRHIAQVMKTTPQLLTIIMTMTKKILIMVTRL